MFTVLDPRAVGGRRQRFGWLTRPADPALGRDAGAGSSRAHLSSQRMTPLALACLAACALGCDGSSVQAAGPVAHPPPVAPSAPSLVAESVAPAPVEPPPARVPPDAPTVCAVDERSDSEELVFSATSFTQTHGDACRLVAPTLRQPRAICGLASDVTTDVLSATAVWSPDAQAKVVFRVVEGPGGAGRLLACVEGTTTAPREVLAFHFDPRGGTQVYVWQTREGAVVSAELGDHGSALSLRWNAGTQSLDVADHWEGAIATPNAQWPRWAPPVPVHGDED